MKQLCLNADDITDQGIANVLWGLAKMRSDWDALPENVSDTDLFRIIKAVHEDVPSSFS